MDRRTALAMIGATALTGTGLAGCGPRKETAPGKANPPAKQTTRIRFATDWRAQAEHGGFYQALASGEFAKRGLDVEIIQGGPGVNVPQLLASGAVEAGMGSNSFIQMNLAQERAPVKAVAAFFQKDPQVLLAHPDPALKSIADLKGRPFLLADASVTAFWVWLKAKYGFTDDQVRKYNYNLAPFLADPRAVQHEDVPEGADLEDAVTTEARRPEVAGQLPGAAGEVVVGKAPPALQHRDPVALLRQPHGGDAAAEAGTDDDVVVGFAHAEA